MNCALDLPVPDYATKSMTSSTGHKTHHYVLCSDWIIRRSEGSITRSVQIFRMRKGSMAKLIWKTLF